MKKLSKYLGIPLVVLLLLALLPIPIYAQMPEPDGDFNISGIEVYRDAQEEDDQLWLFTGTVEYGTTPSYPIAETFILRLMNGAVELGNTTFYSYHDSGYDYGVCSMYFSAAEVASIPVTWGGAFTGKLQGNPTWQWLDDTATTAMAGAVTYDETLTTYTDETTEANSAAANDMNLLTAAQPIVDDAYYFGSNGMFNILTLNVGTADAWTGTYDWQYWDGSAWKTLSATDGTVGFSVAGINDITYTCPTDWQKTTVNAVNLYWIRFIVLTSTGAGAAAALGTQSWTNTLATPPSTENSSINWYDEGSVVAAQERLATRIRGLAVIIENDWGLDLISLVQGVMKLTAAGEDYFTNSIPNLRDMCPDLFLDVLISPDFTEHDLVQDFYMAGDDADHDIFGANWYAQTYTPTSTYAVNGVELKMLRVGTPGNLTVSLRATAGGVPIITTDLASGVIDADTFTTSAFGDWYVVSFTSDYEVTAGTTYAIVARALAGNAANYASWFVNSAGTYATGQACVSTDNDATWGAIAGGVEDFMFAIRATDAFSMSYRNRLANRLVGTRFDMTLLASNFNLSRMWMSTVIWIIFACFLPAIFVCRAANSLKPATLVFAFMLPFGALAGFIDLVVAGLAAFMCMGAAVFVFFYRPSPT